MTAAPQRSQPEAATHHNFYDMCDFFEFLDELRSSGNTNMFGAAPFLAAEFHLELPDARSVLTRWQDTFSDDPLEDRVSKAQIAAKQAQP